MKTLVQTNPHLRDPDTRRRWIEENARESSIFEGARGLDSGVHRRKPRRSMASAKKAAKAS